tara:strand:+ start:78 stop:1055 length:978 start_codon:yes stop_codon:yes gene_type:complete
MNKFISEIKSLLALILIVLVLKETVIELYVVPTTSMENNILKGDMLVGSRFTYGMKVPQKIWIPFTAISIPTFLPEYRFPAFKKVERGDVVVFEYPRDIVYKYVKRCIGLPGDTISIKDREVYVNGNVSQLPNEGQFLMDTYMSSDIIDDEIFLGVDGNKDQYPEITIPKKGDTFPLDESMNWKFLLPIIIYEGNQVEYILGDNSLIFTNTSPRDVQRRTGDKSIHKEYYPSTNATLITPWSDRFKKEHVQYLYINGKPINEIDSYVVKQNYFWMMGDNRDNSEDSRYWGFVPENHILGQPVITWFSINLDTYFPRITRIGKIPN